MASIKKVAQNVLEEARDGIAWIALYKVGRGWNASCFWPDEKTDGSGDFTFEPYDIKEIKAILEIDKNAIFVNGYYTNLGDSDCMNRDSLADALLWQYAMGSSLLKDAVTIE